MSVKGVPVGKYNQQYYLQYDTTNHYMRKCWGLNRNMASLAHNALREIMCLSKIIHNVYRPFPVNNAKISWDRVTFIMMLMSTNRKMKTSPVTSSRNPMTAAMKQLAHNVTWVLYTCNNKSKNIINTYNDNNDNKGNLRDLIAATGLVILPKLDSNRRFFSPCDLETWWMTSKSYRAHLLHYIKLCASSQKTCPETLNSGQNQRLFFCPCDLEIWWMTSKNNRAPLLYYIKLCASFQSHGWIQTGVTVRKRSIRVKIGDFLVPCDLEIWWMTLKNNRTPLLCCFKLYASFHSHRWIKIKVTVRKRSIWVKIGDFLCLVWPWNLMDDLEIQ